MTKPQNWLIVAHCFNMDGRAASHTITDRLPALMRNGITPIVISAPTGKRDSRFPHHQIFSPAPSGFLFEMRYVIGQKVENKFSRRFLKILLAVPLLPLLLIEKIFINLDSHWSWFIAATFRGRKVVNQHHPVLVYSTAGPSSTHLAGYLIARWCGLPWVAEIHDPLIMDNQKRRYQRYRFHRWLEKLIFKHADFVIYFTEKALRSAEKRTKIVNKGHVLRPGANPVPIHSIDYKKREKLHFGYFGSLARHRNLGEFLSALNRLRAENPLAEQQVVLDVYGANLDPVSKQLTEQYKLDEMVQVHGRLEYDPVTGKSGRTQVFEEMHRCDVLLLVHGDSDAGDEYIPSKIYEYLLTNRPILGILIKNSEAESLLQDNGHVVVERGNSEAMVSALGNFYKLWRNGENLSVEQSRTYTTEKAVEKLIEIASELV
ncbi:glycosyltransferase [Desulfobacter sp. UBA2225]|uniref:glycosyltransferase n=1 Tax=Desulfobacter sp. UBA2225 TaxID=1961413 RepID=UPI00257E8B0E|nr:glycosyltransferase [Desulfobacter sp. UBA2225]